MALTDAKRIPVRETLPLPSGLDCKMAKEAFTDNIEHLEALEYISRLRLARAYLLGGNTLDQSSRPRQNVRRFQRHNKVLGQPDLSFLDILTGEVGPDELDILLKSLEARVRERVKKSLYKGMELHFEEFCRSYGLDEFERTVLALLIANNTGKTFRDF